MIKNEKELRRFDDMDAIRTSIYDSIVGGIKSSFPKEGRFVTLDIKDVKIPYDKRYDKDTQKKAIMLERDLTVPVSGTFVLRDKVTGKVLGEKRTSLGQTMYVTERGTMIGNGTEYNLSNQMRLKPGVYSRIKGNDDIEAQFNVEGRLGFRVSMEPTTGKFTMNIGANKIPLYPVLSGLGVDDKSLERYWGKDLLAINKVENKGAIGKLYKRIMGYFAKPTTPEEQSAEILNQFSFMKLDPNTTARTLGKPFSQVTPESILLATNKIKRIYNTEDQPDDRDSLVYKSFWSIDDFIRERIEKDSGLMARKLVQKLDKTKTIASIPAGYFSPWFKKVVRGDERIFPFDQANPLHNYDSMYKTIITGEGGIGNMDAVTSEARAVNPSQFGFIDTVRGPENEKIGIDTRISSNTYKGKDRNLYTKFIDMSTGKPVYLNPQEAMDSVWAFPGEMNKKDKMVTAMVRGEIKMVPRSEIKFYLNNPSSMLSTFLNLVPMVSASSGNRTFMAGKAYPDTLNMIERESPIVRSLLEDGDEEDFETSIGKKVFVEKAKVDGVVLSVGEDKITIMDKDGNRHNYDMYKSFPIGHKVKMDSFPVVKKGDRIKIGQPLTHTNFTDKNGTLAAGKHLLNAYMPFNGFGFDDGVVISESAAKKIGTEQFYKVELPIDSNTMIGKGKFLSVLPSMYEKKHTDQFMDNGLIKPGTRIKKGEPLILAAKKRTLGSQDVALGNLNKLLKNAMDDASMTWDHDADGEVVDVVMTNKKAKVYLKTQTPAEVGDKITGRYGNKGIVSLILPDNEMPKVKRTNKPLDVILNPMGVLGRTNPAQIWEGLLGKIGNEHNLVYRVPLFPKDMSYNKYVRQELKKYNVPDKENVIDKDGNEIPVMVTYPYIYRLSKLSEKIKSGRGLGSYSSNMQPVKGSDENALKAGTMEIMAFQGHNARFNMKDISTIKGEKNDLYWRNSKHGYPLPTPGVDINVFPWIPRGVPFVFSKLIGFLKAAGANVIKTGEKLQILPMTDREIATMSKGAIRNPRFLSAKSLEPERGGFFDMGLTGGMGGTNWNHIELAEPIPNPLMETPIKTLLGFNQDQYESVLSGKSDIDGLTGGMAIKKALSKIKIDDDEIKKVKHEAKTAKAAQKNKLVLKWKYLVGLKNAGISRASDLVWSRFPIMPPIFRPVTASMGSDTVVVSDINKLYRDIMIANEAIRDMKDVLPDSELGEEKMTLYNTIRAAVGTAPHINKEFEKTGVKSLIRYIAGDKPKTGFFFDKVISKTQDLVARGVGRSSGYMKHRFKTPEGKEMYSDIGNFFDPGGKLSDLAMDIDHLYIPEDTAFEQFEPFIMKRLISKGYPALKAEQEWANKTSVARNALEQELEVRPIIMNRAPTLHKFSMMAFKGVLSPYSAVGTNTMVNKPFNLDYDGDAVQMHIPVSEDARKEAFGMLPSRNLWSLKDYKVHYVPSQEDGYGLYLASTQKNPKKPTTKVGSEQDVVEMFRNNKLKFDDIVDIKIERA